MHLLEEEQADEGSPDWSVRLDELLYKVKELKGQCGSANERCRYRQHPPECRVGGEERESELMQSWARE